MSNKIRGKHLPVTPGRRLVAELMHHARKVPSIPLARTCRIDALAAARERVKPPPSWMAIFARAYGLVARDIPELRRSWVTFPWPRLYEHPVSVAAILIEREVNGEPMVLGAKIRGPENHSLSGIDGHLRRFRESPVAQVTPFRQLIRLAGLPWPLNRFFLWRILSLSGFTRASRLGTFVISSLGNLGVEQVHPLTPLTTYFTFGPIDNGMVTLKVIYDHRVMDGRCVARVLAAVEEVLNGALLDEVLDLAERQPLPQFMPSSVTRTR
jgi:hypothetical protein